MATLACMMWGIVKRVRSAKCVCNRDEGSIIFQRRCSVNSLRLGCKKTKTKNRRSIKETMQCNDHEISRITVSKSFRKFAAMILVAILHRLEPASHCFRLIGELGFIS